MTPRAANGRRPTSISAVMPTHCDTERSTPSVIPALYSAASGTSAVR
jgi:hypothetical protein